MSMVSCSITLLCVLCMPALNVFYAVLFPEMFCPPSTFPQFTTVHSSGFAEVSSNSLRQGQACLLNVLMVPLHTSSLVYLASVSFHVFV